jgi:acetyl esterase/lipase
MKQDIEFKSGGVTCRGWLFTPDQGKSPFPCVITAMGGGYVKEFPIMKDHADEFMRHGLASIVFDFRYYGESEGLPRLHTDPWAQIEDCRNAISFAETLPNIYPERLGFWGISTGGGHALIVPAMDSRIKCSVGVVPVVDGYATRRITRSDIWVEKALKLSLEDRRKRFKDETQRGYLPSYSLEPEKEMCSFPYPNQYETFMNVKKVVPEWENKRTIESLELMLNYDAGPFLRRLLNVPVMVIVVEGDTNCPWDIAIEYYHRIPSPYKKLVIIPSEGGRVTHLSLYGDPGKNKDVQKMAEPAAKYLAENLFNPKKEEISQGQVVSCNLLPE